MARNQLQNETRNGNPWGIQPWPCPYGYKNTVEMTESIEVDVDARGTDCQCCGDQKEMKESRLCGSCLAAGCDPSTSTCLRDLQTGVADGS